ncbi:MAG: hypothetical protein ACXVAO_13365 [Vulcanimicrobiaceae bacterium]
MATYGETDPRHHTSQMRQRLDELKNHLREDVDKVEDPRAKALFEVSAEVLGGLSKAFSDYESKSESAWR